MQAHRTLGGWRREAREIVELAAERRGEGDELAAFEFQEA